MAELTNQMLDSWTPGKSVQIDFEFEALTSKIALKTLFDLEDQGDREQFSETLKVAFYLMNTRLRRIFKLPLWLPTPANRRLRSAVAELDRTVQGFIALGRRRQSPGDDLLSRLLLAQAEDGTRDPEAVIGIKPQITLMPANGIPVALQRRAAHSTVEAWRAVRGSEPNIAR
jgi:cytochrome P450